VILAIGSGAPWEAIAETLLRPKKPYQCSRHGPRSRTDNGKRRVAAGADDAGVRPEE